MCALIPAFPHDFGIVRRLKRLRELGRDAAGLALIEFAYTLPIFVGFGLVGIEFTNVVLAHQKTERIASTIADQVASNQVPPNERQIRDMFGAVDLIASPFDFDANGNVIITAVVGIRDPEDDEIQNKIAWQRCRVKDGFESTIGEQWEDSIDVADGPEVDLPNDIELTQNQMVIVVEVFFPYSEIISAEIVDGFLPNDGIFQERAMYRTRGGALMSITPVTGVEEQSCET
ncbi:MAG: TadE/TadG family type IV pilus assembly protein [Pseudomonadota bacterium]